MNQFWCSFEHISYFRKCINAFESKFDDLTKFLSKSSNCETDEDGDEEDDDETNSDDSDSDGDIEDGDVEGGGPGDNDDQRGHIDDGVNVREHVDASASSSDQGVAVAVPVVTR